MPKNTRSILTQNRMLVPDNKKLALESVINERIQDFLEGGGFSKKSKILLSFF